MDWHREDAEIVATRDFGERAASCWRWPAAFRQRTRSCNSAEERSAIHDSGFGAHRRGNAAGGEGARKRESATGNVVTTTFTDSSGRFEAPAEGAGSVILAVQEQGYEPVEQRVMWALRVRREW